ncbi:hypothetical protein X801_01293 [Opisthorchis viverrini]|uniref:Uncharacterized protein n=1 Tax=Opisthorchis viverrini TaxID=6198 RepID=A0A1S8X7Y7_OPIVI|nr:hypothetical protein X801_01293 [Opisthorchis viverrini]
MRYSSSWVNPPSKVISSTMHRTTSVNSTFLRHTYRIDVQTAIQHLRKPYHWPFPFVYDVNGPFKDGHQAIWTHPVKALKTEQIFGILIELLGCPNEGWAKNAYFGLLDIIKHGDERQVNDGLKGNGVYAFRKLFSSSPHNSTTWDGFVAGLDIYERLICLNPTSRKLCVTAFRQILRPLFDLYRKRENAMKFGVPKEHLGGFPVSKSVQLSDALQVRRPHHKERNVPFYGETTVRQVFGRLTQLPFEVTLNSWLHRIEAMVALHAGVNSDEHEYIVAYIKRWCPTYEALKVPARKHPKKPNTKQSVQKPKKRTITQIVLDDLDESAARNKSEVRQLSLRRGPLFCFSGPPKECATEQYIAHLNEVKIESHKLVDLKVDHTECDISEQPSSTWLKRRATSIVNKVLVGLDDIKEGPHLVLGARSSEPFTSTTRDISSTDELPVDLQPFKSKNSGDNQEPHSKPPHYVSQLTSDRPNKRSSDDYAMAEDVDFKGCEDSDKTDDVLESKTDQYVDVFKIKPITIREDPSSLIVNRSEGTHGIMGIDYLVEAEEVSIAQSSLSGELDDSQEYHFMIVESSAVAEKNAEESVVNKPPKQPAVEWKQQKKTNLDEIHNNDEALRQLKSPEHSLSLPTQLLIPKTIERHESLSNNLDEVLVIRSQKARLKLTDTQESDGRMTASVQTSPENGTETSDRKLELKIRVKSPSKNKPPTVKADAESDSNKETKHLVTGFVNTVIKRALQVYQSDQSRYSPSNRDPKSDESLHGLEQPDTTLVKVTEIFHDIQSPVHHSPVHQVPDHTGRIDAEDRNREPPPFSPNKTASSAESSSNVHKENTGPLFQWLPLEHEHDSLDQLGIFDGVQNDESSHPQQVARESYTMSMPVNLVIEAMEEQMESTANTPVIPFSLSGTIKLHELLRRNPDLSAFLMRKLDGTGTTTYQPLKSCQDVKNEQTSPPNELNSRRLEFIHTELSVPVTLEDLETVMLSGPGKNSTDASVGPDTQEKQAVRLRIQLQANASWIDDATPYPVDIDTQICTDVSKLEINHIGSEPPETLHGTISSQEIT